MEHGLGVCMIMYLTQRHAGGKLPSVILLGTSILGLEARASLKEEKGRSGPTDHELADNSTSRNSNINKESGPSPLASPCAVIRRMPDVRVPLTSDGAHGAHIRYVYVRVHCATPEKKRR